LIPTTGNPSLLERCLDSLLSRTTYRNFEVLLLVNEVQQNEARRAELLRGAALRARVRVLYYADRPFNYTWVNNWAANESSGEVLCLLNDDTEVITPDWLERLVARAMLPDVGAVGVMMYYPDNTIQHAGVILGLSGIAGHAFLQENRGIGGYFGRACLEQDLSCVTAGCLAIQRDVFPRARRIRRAVRHRFQRCRLLYPASGRRPAHHMDAYRRARSPRVSVGRSARFTRASRGISRGRGIDAQTLGSGARLRPR
jgi:GT2 family glycosyltransferase